MKVFVNSIHKSGTNLVEKLIVLAGVTKSGKSLAMTSVLGRHETIKNILRSNHLSASSVSIGLGIPVSVSYLWLKRYFSSVKANMYLSGHAAYSEQLSYLLACEKIKSIQIYRDPRAVLASWARYVVEGDNHYLPLHRVLKEKSFDDRLRFILHGGNVSDSLYYSSFRELLQRSAGWIDDRNTIAVRFEDLVGAQGGGSDEIQRQTIESILKHIGYEYSQEDLDKLQKNLYGGTHTFRSGRIDSWKDVIDDELNHLIIQKLKDCDVVKKLGYADFLN